MEDKIILDIENIEKNIEKNIEDKLNKIYVNEEDINKVHILGNTINKAISGDLVSRNTVVLYIKNMLLKDFYIYKMDSDKKLLEYVLGSKSITKDNIDYIIHFDNKNRLSYRDKFEIVLHKYVELHGDNAFIELKKKYSYVYVEYEKYYRNIRYEYNKEDIDKMYDNEISSLTFDKKIDIVSYRIYADLYGLSELDMLSVLNVNEVGISGNFVYCWSDNKIRLNFFEMSNKKIELIQNKAIQFDSSSKQLDSSNPEVLTHRINDSRVTVLQEPYSTDRHIAIRIFNQKKSSVDDLYNVSKQKKLITMLVKNGESIVFQGGLGTGKTTTMSTLLGILDDTCHIGTIEDYFEQHNRKKYDDKRIVELQKTDSKSLFDAVKTLLRMSIDVADVGEIRDGEALFSFIQLLQSVSVGAWCTTHIVNPETTVSRLKNMLMSTGLYSTEKSAVRDIVNYINCIFQHEIINGSRVISKIVEIVPIEDDLYNEEISINLSYQDLKKKYMYQKLRNDPNNIYKLNYIMSYDDKGKLNFNNYPSMRMIRKANKNPDVMNYMKEIICMIFDETKKPIPKEIIDILDL